jgi:hypothetical protein
MSIWIYVLIIIAVAVFGGRNYLKGFIIDFVNKRKGKEKQKTVKSDFVYTPVRSSRVFEFSIEIDELGDGKASISVVKTSK